MKFSSIFLLILTIAIVSFSCNKDDDDGNDPQPDESYLTIKNMSLSDGATIEATSNLEVEVEYKIIDAEWDAGDSYTFQLLYLDLDGAWFFIGHNWDKAVTQSSGSITKSFDIGRMKDITQAQYPYKMLFAISSETVWVESKIITFN